MVLKRSFKGNDARTAAGYATVSAVGCAMIAAAVSTWPWAMAAAIFGGISLLTLWYVNFVRPYRRRRALKAATKTYFLVPASTQHECSYATMDDKEHLLKDLSVRPNTELIVDLVMHVKQDISYSEVIVGFMGDPSRKPQIKKYTNRYILVGKGREVDPMTGATEDYIDKHRYYHRKFPLVVTKGNVLSMAFTIETQSEGLFPLQISFISDEPIEGEWGLFLTVENTPTIKQKCAEPEHRQLDCWKNGIAPPI